MLARVLGIGVVVVLATGCRKHAPVPNPGPSASAVPSAAPAPLTLPARPVSGEVAFDLVATANGAALAWGQGRDLMVALLDERGEPRGEPIRIERTAGPAGTPLEVNAGSVDDKLGVVWVDRDGANATSWGALGDASTRSFAKAAALGSTSVDDPGQRGSLALAASDRGEIVVLRRGLDEPCAQEKGKTCATFAFRELLSTGPEPRGLPLSVPAPCSRALVGFEIVHERWHYAVCSTDEGRPITTLFNVQRSPFYAEAKRSLEGCRPIAMLPLGNNVLVTGDCDNGRRAMRTGDMNTPLTSVELSKLTASCERGKPTLRTASATPFTLVLEQPLSGLGPLLPPTFAAPGARAAWTGSRLLVASFVRQKVALRRFVCRGADLVAE